MSEIQEICKGISVTWHHCPGEDNPADFVSRGTTVVQLKEQKWMAGPPWSMYKNSCSVEPPITPVDTEVRVQAIVATQKRTGGGLGFPNGQEFWQWFVECFLGNIVSRRSLRLSN